MELGDIMSVENVISTYRARAIQLRQIRGVGYDAGMDEHFNEQYALIWDAAADILEEDIRQSNRVHQDKT